jgi:hypothetical protein
LAASEITTNRFALVSVTGEAADSDENSTKTAATAPRSNTFMFISLERE